MLTFDLLFFQVRKHTTDESASGSRRILATTYACSGVVAVESESQTSWTSCYLLPSAILGQFKQMQIKLVWDSVLAPWGEWMVCILSRCPHGDLSRWPVLLCSWLGQPNRRLPKLLCWCCAASDLIENFFVAVAEEKEDWEDKKEEEKRRALTFSNGDKHCLGSLKGSFRTLQSHSFIWQTLTLLKW